MNDAIPSAINAVVLDPVEAARAAKLRYVSDKKPGIARVRVESGFEYHDIDGTLITDEEVLARIRKLAIPPAYTDVWICRDPRGHLQAVGRDARGRKQYRYHPRWRAVRDENKYGKMLIFGRVLPKVREQVKHDLALHGLPKRKVVAAVVALLEKTMIRVGNEEYAKQNKSFGLTTLRNRHAHVKGSHVEFDFRGKHGINHHIDLEDRRLARIVERCRDLPGQDLFQYVDHDGERHSVGSDDVNEYLHEVTGEEITAKDFRTWAATNLAAAALADLRAFRHPGGSEEGGGQGGGERGQEARQHAGDLPQVLHPSGRVRGLPRRQPRRGLEAARRRAAGPARRRAERAGSGADRLPQPPPR